MNIPISYLRQLWRWATLTKLDIISVQGIIEVCTKYSYNCKMESLNQSFIFRFFHIYKIRAGYLRKCSWYLWSRFIVLLIVFQKSFNISKFLIYQNNFYQPKYFCYLDLVAFKVETKFVIVKVWSKTKRTFCDLNSQYNLMVW